MLLSSGFAFSQISDLRSQIRDSVSASEVPRSVGTGCFQIRDFKSQIRTPLRHHRSFLPDGVANRTLLRTDGQRQQREQGHQRPEQAEKCQTESHQGGHP